MKKFKNKRILITAGPTWVAIDNVRVISNMATGETGRLLAQALIKSGAKVTLLSGPFSFDHLAGHLLKELKSKRYDIVIHSAAVSDYRPDKVCSGKLGSGMNLLRINLVKTPKIINLIKKVSPDSRLIGFKFEPGTLRKELIRKARALLNKAKAEFIVANTLSGSNYRAYIVSRAETLGPFLNKRLMINSLIKALG